MTAIEKSNRYTSNKVLLITCSKRAELACGHWRITPWYLLSCSYAIVQCTCMPMLTNVGRENCKHWQYNHIMSIRTSQALQALRTTLKVITRLLPLFCSGKMHGQYYQLYFNNFCLRRSHLTMLLCVHPTAYRIHLVLTLCSHGCMQTRGN
jgi:hypothetical protein